MRLFHLDLRFIAGVAGQSATTQPQLRDSPPPAPFPLLSPPSSATTLCFSTRTFHMVHLQAYCTAKYLRCPAPIAPALSHRFNYVDFSRRSQLSYKPWPTSDSPPPDSPLLPGPSKYCPVDSPAQCKTSAVSGNPAPTHPLPTAPPLRANNHHFCNTGRSAITKKLQTSYLSVWRPFRRGQTPQNNRCTGTG